MKVEHIEMFLQIADNGSISKTAQQGYITQQGLSLALKQIESELGISLFYRNNKGVSLTEEGKAFYRTGKKMLEAYKEYIYALRSGEENDVVNLFIEKGFYKALPSFSEAAFARRGGWYFSIIEKGAAEIVNMIRVNQGIGVFSIRAGEDPNMLQIAEHEGVKVCKLGQETKVVYVVHKTNPAAHCSPEDVMALFDKMKCVITTSEFDLNLYTSIIRKTICAPDILEHQTLLRKPQFFSIMDYNTYRLKYNPQEFVIVGERELQRPIEYYVAFHLKDTQKNRELEEEVKKYLKEFVR